MVLPLANTNDKHTQVIWASRTSRCGWGASGGMWLPETAVDIPSLEVLVDHGIKFTILAPRQAKRTRRLSGARRWRDVNEGDLDTSVPYLCTLPSGRQIAIFFYNGPSRTGSPTAACSTAARTSPCGWSTRFPTTTSGPLVHVATDGESFGHHHHHGDMALAYCLHHIAANKLAKITIYGEFLAKFPPEHEVEIWENSSWSCVHGVER
jgi:predicted glycosyl hydrolase (DUF1957 family)